MTRSDTPGLILGRYVGSEAAMTAAKLQPRPQGQLMVEVNTAMSTLTMFPLNTLYGHEEFLSPKYSQIRSIEVDVEIEDEPKESWELSELLTQVPRGLGHDFQYGLGLPKVYRIIVDLIEDESSCTRLIISNKRASGIHGSAFVISRSDFEGIRAELDRVTSRGYMATARVKETVVHNSLSSAFGITPMTLRRGRHPITQFIADEAADSPELDEVQQRDLLNAALRETKRLANSKPAQLFKLRNDIELVSLESLISRFEEALSQFHTESFWQAFFTNNPFALHLVFGYSIVQVQGQASVGGIRIEGGGEKVTDFLFKNSLTNNVGIFEIKRPTTDLLLTKPYRAGVFSPSKELAGSISQVLDQRYQLQKSLTAKKESSRDYASNSIRSAVV